MKRAALRQAISEAMAAFAARGTPVKAMRACGNGDVLLLTDMPADALPSDNDTGEWVDLAGETEIPRASGA